MPVINNIGSNGQTGNDLALKKAVFSSLISASYKKRSSFSVETSGSFPVGPST